MNTGQPAHIDVTRARELLAAAVATQGPDFVYIPYKQASCWYEKASIGDVCYSTGRSVAPGDPRITSPCLIGVCMDLAGHTFHHGAGYRTQILAIRHELPDEREWASDEAKRFWRYAQLAQDSGSSWGEAQQAAEDSFYRLLEEERQRLAQEAATVDQLGRSEK